MDRRFSGMALAASVALSAFIFSCGDSAPADDPPGGAASGRVPISKIEISSGTLVPSFDPSVLDYSVDVENSVSSVRITATKGDRDATVSLTPASDPIPLSVGRNDVAVTATAKDGTVTTYTIVIARAAGSNADLAVLRSPVGIMEPDFSPSIAAYAIYVDNTVDKLWPVIEPSDSEAEVEFAPDEYPFLLFVGHTTFFISVTAPDGEATRSYRLEVVRAPATRDLPPAAEGDWLLAKDEYIVSFDAPVMTYYGEGGPTEFVAQRAVDSGDIYMIYADKKCARLLPGITWDGTAFRRNGYRLLKN